MNYLNQIEQLKEFRQSVYNAFTQGADVLMNLIDALSSNTTAQSVVELSLNPPFERGYSALFKGIANFHQSPSSRQKKQQKTDKSKPATKRETTVKQPSNESSRAVGSPDATVEQVEAAKAGNWPQKAIHQPEATVGAANPLQKAVGSPDATVEQVPATNLPQKAVGSPDATAKQPNSPQKAVGSPEAGPEQVGTANSPQKAVGSPEAGPEQVGTANSPQKAVGSPEAGPEQIGAANSPQMPVISKEELTARMLEDRQARVGLEHQLLRVVLPYLPQPARRPFYLFGLDVTSQPRQFSKTLSDRGFVYHPNAIKGNKPVTIGHQYSLLAYLPEKRESATPPWIVPLSTRRVATDQDKELIGMEQVELLMDDKQLPFHNQLCALVGDTSYSKRSFLDASSKFNNLVTIARVRSDRTFYQKYQPAGESKKGHPTWYGERFSLKEPQTWHQADYTAQTTFTSRRGNQYIIKIEAWDNMLMKGKDGIEMHKHPFRLLRIRSFKEDGQPAFKRDLWLIVVGKKRQKLDLLDIYEAYRQRYDLEHYFRFGKQKLLMTAFQTPEVEREENWWQIVQLAYTQLWLAQPLALEMPRPWEKYLPKREGQMPSPSTVQRDFGRIIRQLGTPAAAPKVRHKGAGRAKGQTLVPRARPKVVKKGKKSHSNQAATFQN